MSNFEDFWHISTKFIYANQIGLKFQMDLLEDLQLERDLVQLQDEVAAEVAEEVPRRRRRFRQRTSEIFFEQMTEFEFH